MKKQKLCGIFISAVITAGLLTSCGTNNTDTSAPDDTQPEIQTSAEEELSPKVTVEGTKFMVGGKELWINGVNTPWEYWNDFGGSFDPTFWDSHFSDLHDIGVNAVRVWLNCDSMVSIKLKPSGEVREVSEQHWSDIDQLFEIAEKHQIYLMPTLLSFDHCKNGQYTDRWRAVITDENAMQSYIDSYVKPFAERYGSNPYLLGIDLMNEPDWVHESADCGQLSLDALSNFFAKCTAGIHETNPDTLVTVGIGMIKYNSDNGNCMGNIVSDEMMKALGGDKACLDFYSTHYYNYMKPYWGCPYDMSPEDYGLDGSKPMFIGETNAEGGETLIGLYERCYNNGWNGVMLWRSNDVENRAENWNDIAAATQNMESAAGDKVFPLGKN